MSGCSTSTPAGASTRARPHWPGTTCGLWLAWCWSAASRRHGARPAEAVRNRLQTERIDMAVLEIDDAETLGRDLVGPVVRSGALAEAIIDAVAEDNPGRDVLVVDRDDYVRIHTARECRLTRASLEK